MYIHVYIFMYTHIYIHVSPRNAPASDAPRHQPRTKNRTQKVRTDNHLLSLLRSATERPLVTITGTAACFDDWKVRCSAHLLAEKLKECRGEATRHDPWHSSVLRCVGSVYLFVEELKERKGEATRHDHRHSHGGGGVAPLLDAILLSNPPVILLHGSTSDVSDVCVYIYIYVYTYIYRCMYINFFSSSPAQSVCPPPTMATRVTWMKYTYMYVCRDIYATVVCIFYLLLL